MNRVCALSWWHAAVASSVAAVALALLLHRMGPSLGLWFLKPPIDSPFFAYPLFALACSLSAYCRPSVIVVVFVQLTVLAAGFLHVLWIMGTVPLKVDLRLMFVATTGHALLWASGLCAVTAVIAALRRLPPS